MINHVIMRGFVASEPIIRATEKGKFANLRLATIERIKRTSGQIMEHTEWHSITFWGKEAEVVDQRVRLGMAIHVEGALRHREWQDRAGKVNKVSEVSVSKLEILEGGLEGYSLPKSILEAMPLDYNAISSKQKNQQAECKIEVKIPMDDPDKLPF